MTTTVDSEVITRCVLELLAEPRYARGGCIVRVVEEVMTLDRGIEQKELDVVLRKMRYEEKTIAAKGKGLTRDREPWHPDDVLELTPKGKDILRKARATTQFNVRAPQRILQELASVVSRGESTSEVAIELIDEGVRMRKYPGIDFRTTATGRKPHVTGTGLSVWEMFHIWKAFGESVERLLKHYPHLAAAHAIAGVTYAQAHLHEMPTGEWGTKPAFAREVKV